MSSDYEQAVKDYEQAIKTGDETKIHAAIINLRKIEQTQMMAAEIVESLVRLITRK